MAPRGPFERTADVGSFGLADRHCVNREAQADQTHHRGRRGLRGGFELPAPEGDREEDLGQDVLEPHHETGLRDGDPDGQDHPGLRLRRGAEKSREQNAA